MLADLLPVLACPWCRAGDLTSTRPIPKGGRIIDGGLRCDACGRTTAVRGGIWHAMGPHRVHRTAAQLSNVVPPVPHLYERLWRVRSLGLLSRAPFPIEEELALLTSRMEPGPGRPMVDVACSEGLYARALASAGSPVLAVDHSVAFLRRTALRAGRLPVAPVRALAQHLPVLDATLSGAVMGGSLNEIGDEAAAIAELVRVLAADGRAALMWLAPATTKVGRFAQFLARPAGIRFPADETVAEWFRRSGVSSTALRHEPPRGVVRFVTLRASV